MIIGVGAINCIDKNKNICRKAVADAALKRLINTAEEIKSSAVIRR